VTVEQHEQPGAPQADCGKEVGRRRVLRIGGMAAAGAGLAAIASSATASPASAASGDKVTLGAENKATQPTEVVMTGYDFAYTGAIHAFNRDGHVGLVAAGNLGVWASGHGGVLAEATDLEGV
jgi:hypothetical protein